LLLHLLHHVVMAGVNLKLAVTLHFLKLVHR
jgi:hypothetical protein